MTEISNQTPQKKQENPLVSIAFNIALPVFVLNQLTKRLDENGPLIALIVALALPIGYGIYDYITRHHKSWMSILGIVNLLMTGGLALLKLEGFWFAVKEAAFPLILGLGVLATAFTSKPLMKTLIFNLDALNLAKINEKLDQLNKHQSLTKHLKTSTVLFAISFFISSLLNFILAIKIFIPIDTALPELQRSEILNSQIAEMTWRGFVVIALPLMIFSMGVMWHVISGITKFTELKMNEILPVSMESESNQK